MAESHIRNPADPQLPGQLQKGLKGERRSHQNLPIPPILGGLKSSDLPGREDFQTSVWAVNMY